MRYAGSLPVATDCGLHGYEVGGGLEDAKKIFTLPALRNSHHGLSACITHAKIGVPRNHSTAQITNGLGRRYVYGRHARLLQAGGNLNDVRRAAPAQDRGRTHQAGAGQHLRF